MSNRLPDPFALAARRWGDEWKQRGSEPEASERVVRIGVDRVAADDGTVAEHNAWAAIPSGDVRRRSDGDEWLEHMRARRRELFGAEPPVRPWEFAPRPIPTAEDREREQIAEREARQRFEARRPPPSEPPHPLRPGPDDERRPSLLARLRERLR